MKHRRNTVNYKKSHAGSQGSIFEAQGRRWRMANGWRWFNRLTVQEFNDEKTRGRRWHGAYG